MSNDIEKVILTKNATMTKSILLSETEVILDDDKPIIVIDPGHGYTQKNTGMASRIYTYISKDGKSVEANVEELPQYVIDNLSEYLDPDPGKVKEDLNRPERGLVFDVSVKLKALLEKAGYTVLLTRTERKIEGVDGPKTRQARVDLAHNNKADYFISIHADGADGYIASGSHAIYPNSNNADTLKFSKELAEDIMSSYTVVTVVKSSPKKDIRGLQVLRNSHKTTRKVLVELGFITTPKDAKAMFSNIDKMAEQLKDGLVKNIKKHFK